METILIVDDEPHLRAILRQVLENEGLECVEASDGDLALRILFDHPSIALVVTDFQMPRMNGLQLLTRMTTHPTLWNIPSIFVTAQHSADLRREAFRAGAHRVLFKPYNFTDLKACVYGLLRSLQAA